MKTCTKCKKSKPLEDFSKHKETKDGRQGHCKTCNKQIVRRRRLAKGGTTLEMSGTKKFSTERYCEVCDETKDWKAYYAEQGMCRDCWRAALSEAALGSPEPHHSSTKKKQSVEDVIAFLDKMVAKKQKKK